VEAVQSHREWIADEVLALEIIVDERIEPHHAAQSVDIDGQAVGIAFERAV
jgi:hypothetical protein